MTDGIAELYSAARAELRTVLHVTAGDGAVPPKARGQTVLPWRDVLHVGPVPALPVTRLRQIRARYLASLGWINAWDALEWFARRDRTLLDHRGEHVLWLGSGLAHQLVLVHVLSMLCEADVDPGRVTLVGAEFSPERLDDRRHGARLSATAMESADQAWRALTDPEPLGYADIVCSWSQQLPSLPDAFNRLAREFPSTRDGLSLTERNILLTLAEGDLTIGEVFTWSRIHEPEPFLDLRTCAHLVGELARGERPLLTVERSVQVEPRGWSVRLTPDGRRVLDGDANRLDLIGIDRWIGGTHLVGRRPDWRWDEAEEALVG
jgi:hypothetical protein